MTFDVARRLADAHGAVGNTQTLVSACAAVGYQHPDLTSHGAQIAEWFGCDDGLDLGVLGADCERLHSALTIAEGAMRLEDAAGEELSGAWAGASGSAAADFVARHRRTVGALVDSLRFAADRCAFLRDSLWRIVDMKVEAAIIIDDRRLGERTAWLAAARTVTSGGQDHSAAVGIVEKAVVPYVDSDIRIDWVDAMKSARASADKAYGEVLSSLGRSAAIDFDLPARLVPVSGAPNAAACAPPVRDLGSQQHWQSPAERGLSIPPQQFRSPAAVPAPEASLAASPPARPAAAEAPPFASPTSGGFPSGLAAMPNFDGFSSGLSDPSPMHSPMPFGGIGDADPGEFGANDPDPPSDDPAEDSDDQRDEQAHDSDDDDDGDPPKADADGVENVEGDADIEGVETGSTEAGDPSVEDESPPPTVNPPVADAVGESEEVRTPCEIAADELPQVGQ